MAPIAEELAKKQRDISIAEFFEKNRHLLGFDSKRKSILTAVKEGVDNGLDACEEARIPAEITVTIKQTGTDRYRVIIQDNGPGIMKKQIPKIFAKLLYGSKFHALIQSRGQQGIGITAAGLYSQLTTGKPTVVTTKTGPNKPAHRVELKLDILKNEPQIIKEEIDLDFRLPHGTRVEMEMEAQFVSKGSSSIYEYLRRTSIVNPSAQIIFNDPTPSKFIFNRTTNKLPKMPKEIKPHPYGVELGIFMRMLKTTSKKTIQSFLTGEFSRVGSTTAKRVLKKAELHNATRPYTLTREQAEKLIKTLQTEKLMVPPLDCLSPIGANSLEASMKTELSAELVVTVTRPASVYRGMPFQIEAGIAFGGNLKSEGQAEIMRFANRVPLLYEKSACAITRSIGEIDWRRYGLSQTGGRGVPYGPLTVAIHMASVWVPFTSESKAAIASYPIIVKEIKLALQECARHLRNYLKRQYRRQRDQARIDAFTRYSKELAGAIADLTRGNKEKIAELIEESLMKNTKAMIKVKEGKQ